VTDEAPFIKLTQRGPLLHIESNQTEAGKLWMLEGAKFCIVSGAARGPSLAPSVPDAPSNVAYRTPGFRPAPVA